MSSYALQKTTRPREPKPLMPTWVNVSKEFMNNLSRQGINKPRATTHGTRVDLETFIEEAIITCIQ